MPSETSEMDAYVLADGEGNLSLVSWLSTDDMLYFQSPEGDESLQAMCSGMVLPPSVVEAAKERFKAFKELKEPSYTQGDESDCDDVPECLSVPEGGISRHILGSEGPAEARDLCAATLEPLHTTRC